MKVLISGYYGFGNAGDELILESILTELKARNNEIEITVLSAQPERTSMVNRVPALNRWNIFKVLWSIYRTDILISGGGGLFQDTTGNLSLYYYLLIIIAAKVLRKKIFLYAVGINELKQINRIITALVLKLADRITTRENYSYDLLTKWGCDQVNMDVTADPVLHKDVPISAFRVTQPKVAFVLKSPKTDSAQAADIFAKLCDSLGQRIGAKIIFIPFHIDRDIPFTLLVMNSMRSTARLIQWSKAHELYDIFSEMDMVISQRLHALILASIYKIPLVGISEDPKLERFLRELGQKNILGLADANPYSLLAVIADVWEWRDEFRKNAGNILPSLRLRSRLTADIFNNEFLNNLSIEGGRETNK